MRTDEYGNLMNLVGMPSLGGNTGNAYNSMQYGQGNNNALNYGTSTLNPNEKFKVGLSDSLRNNQNNNSLFDMDSMFGESGWLSGGASALSSLGGLWAGMQQVGLAQDQFDMTKALTNKNISNIATSHNQRLADSVDAKNAAYGSDRANIDRAAYLQKHSVDGSAV